MVCGMDTSTLNTFDLGGVYKPNVYVGEIIWTLPDGYDTLTVVFGNAHTVQTVYLYINGVEKETCGPTTKKTYVCLFLLSIMCIW